MKNLTATFGKTAPSRIIVFRWYSKFKRGRQVLKMTARLAVLKTGSRQAILPLLLPQKMWKL